MRFPNRTGRLCAPWLMMAALIILPFGIGVTLLWSSPVAADSRSGRSPARVTYARDVAPILQKNCMSCHRPGEVAPFSLTGYEDARKRAKQIAVVTKSRVMPPWKAESNGEFHDEMKLTESEIATLSAWAENGAPMGNPKELPPNPKFSSGWHLGEPDVVFDIGGDYELPAEGSDVYRNFVIPTSFPEDRWISAMEVRPGNRAVVHHVLVFTDTSGTARKLDAKDPGPGYSTFGGVGFLPAGGLGGWAPGNLPRHLPDGVGSLLPKGADLVLQVHYNMSGKPEKDRTKIGLHFARKPVDKHLRIFPLIAPFLRIPPGDKNHVVEASFPVPMAVQVLQVTPHMHLLGREMTVTATLPDRTQKRIVYVPDWDFNWQNTYSFKEPLNLPAGAWLKLRARYDNSEENPRNPSRPPKLVTWGEKTTDEMCIAFIAYTVNAESLTKGRSVSGLLRQGRARLERARAFLQPPAGRRER